MSYRLAESLNPRLPDSPGGTRRSPQNPYGREELPPLPSTEPLTSFLSKGNHSPTYPPSTLPRGSVPDHVRRNSLNLTNTGYPYYQHSQRGSNGSPPGGLRSSGPSLHPGPRSPVQAGPYMYGPPTGGPWPGYFERARQNSNDFTTRDEVREETPINIPHHKPYYPPYPLPRKDSQSEVINAVVLENSNGNTINVNTVVNKNNLNPGNRGNNDRFLFNNDYLDGDSNNTNNTNNMYNTNNMNNATNTNIAHRYSISHSSPTSSPNISPKSSFNLPLPILSGRPSYQTSPTAPTSTPLGLHTTTTTTTTVTTTTTTNTEPVVAGICLDYEPPLQDQPDPEATGYRYSLRQRNRQTRSDQQHQQRIYQQKQEQDQDQLEQQYEPERRLKRELDESTDRESKRRRDSNYVVLRKGRDHSNESEEEKRLKTKEWMNQVKGLSHFTCSASILPFLLSSFFSFS